MHERSTGATHRTDLYWVALTAAVAAMKKFISNISSSTASAVNSAVKQIDNKLDKALVQPEQQGHVGQPVAENIHYVRLG